MDMKHNRGDTCTRTNTHWHTHIRNAEESYSTVCEAQGLDEKWGWGLVIVSFTQYLVLALAGRIV